MMGESPQHSGFQSDVELDKIFHVLDQESVGYITVDKFTEALNSFIPNEFPREKLNSLLDHLDPQSDGRIYLNDFRKAISRLRIMADDSTVASLRVSQGSGGDAATPTGDDNDAANGNGDADDAEIVAHGKATNGGVRGAWAVSSDPANAAAAVDELDCAIMQHEEDLSSSLVVDTSSHWQTTAAGPGKPTSATEESYEDWGSGELGTGSGFLIDIGSPPSEASGGGSAVKPPLPPDAQTQLERGSEVRGTWPRHRPRPDNIKLNVPSRSPSLRSPHPSRRPSRTGALLNGLHRPPSANQLAQQLYSTSSGRSSPRTSGDGMFYDDGDFPDAGLYSDEMKDQLKLLSEKFEELKNSQSMSDSRHNKLIEENQLLRERLSRQEDDYREAEAKLRRKVDDDKARSKAKLAKVTRDKEAEIERLIDKLRQSEAALSEHRVESTRHRTEAERLRAESARLEERAEQLDSRLGACRDEAERHREAGRRELDAAKRERDQAQALLEELNHELDSWRSGGAGATTGATGGAGRDRASSAAEALTRYREVEQLAKRLTHENKSLREQLEEAQAELLTRGLEEGKALLLRHSGNASLAAELETMTKDELMDLLVREKDANEKLRSYIDRILLRIMEKQPDLLEVGFLA